MQARKVKERGVTLVTASSNQTLDHQTPSWALIERLRRRHQVHAACAAQDDQEPWARRHPAPSASSGGAVWLVEGQGLISDKG